MTTDIAARATLASVASGSVLQALCASDCYDFHHLPDLPEHTIVVADRGVLLSVTDDADATFRDGILDAATRLHLDAALLRIDPREVGPITVDLALGLLSGAPLTLANFALFETPKGDLWFVPQTCRPAVEITPEGFVLELVAPFDTLSQRDAGVLRASRSVHRILEPAEAL
ncbi:hypothetical protein [Stakelama saccharophila]|uniref:Uncharacterized protein n=1 Tax=Stakelama saccharophila TaxID=3075605 RepID=A0ABZ0B7G1_9SPHN|nr:hypothetical protein [Stakelama sp. W311]WNO53172.1 hypothetical protein RPR59_12055 [Stakelama sp. W311]